MEQINLVELQSISKRKELNKLKLYNKLLVNCHKKIKEKAKNNEMKCIYNVPQYTFGYPLYNYDELVKYIKDALLKNGFNINEINPGTITISWDDDDKIKTSKQPNNTGAGAVNYRPIEDYNPTGNILYNNNSLEAIKQKSIKFLNI